MKMKRMSSMFCAVAIFGTASVAMAGAYGEPEQAEEMPRSAPVAAEVVATEEFSPFLYIGAGGLYSQEFFDGDAHQINQTYGWGVNGRIGYRFHEYVAIELLSENTVEFDADSGSGAGSVDNIDRKFYSLMPNVKVFPIQGFCEPFLSIGAGFVYADAGNQNEVTRPVGNISHFTGVDDGAGFGMRFGIGADFYATEQIYIEAELAYQLPMTGNVNNYDHLNVALGLGYAFN